MTQEYYSIITNGGLSKHAAASLGGAPINLTHLAIGDSNGIAYNPSASATALQNELHRVALTSVVVDESNSNQLIIEALIGEEVGPFYIREVGVFDSAGSLFALGKFPETFKPNLPSGSGKRLYVRMILGFASTPQVSLSVSSQAINNDPNFSTNVFASLAQKLAKAANLSDLANVAQSRINLGLEIGVNVQAFAANLAALAALTGAAKKVPIFTGAGAMAAADLFSNRNAIINGDFNIWQRATSFVAIGVNTYNADRWKYAKNSAAVHDISRSTDVPTVAQSGRLFSYSVLIDCQTIAASVATSDYVVYQQAIEGYNFLSIAQRTSTLSFWVKATKIGTYCICLLNSGVDRSYVAEYTINASDTWEYKTITIPASPNSGTWNYSNGAGIFVTFTLCAGSTYQTTANTWQNGNFMATANQLNACDNAANNFRLCGVQLEAGSIATPFEQRTFQQELELCQRYYETTYDQVAAGTATGTGRFIASNASSSFLTPTSIVFKVSKRAIPSCAVYSDATGAVNKVYTGSADINASVTEAAKNHLIMAVASAMGGQFSFQWKADAEL
jgi:hypothetical protein